MSPRDLNDVSDDKLSEQERLRREIAEYEALLEDELKPISPSFLKGGKEVAGENVSPPLTEEIPSTMPSSASSISITEGLVAEQQVISEVKPQIKPKNKEDVLMEIAERDTQLIKEEDVFPAKPEDEETRLFHQLVQNYLPKSLSVEINDLIEATVVAVSSKYVLVDLGGKAEVVIDIDELADEKGDINVHVGDRIKVLVTGWDEENEQVIVSHQLAKQKEALNLIQRAYAEHLPVNVKVEEVVKTGVIANIGGIRGFIPASQLDITRVEDLGQFVGKELSVMVLEVDKTGKRVIFSRRRLLEEELEKRRNNLLSSLNAGDEITGRVKSVMDFGVFIELDGIDGFVPREEVSWDKGTHPSEYFKEGKTVKLKVINVDKEQGKITLSRRQLKANPWDKIEENYAPGKVVRGDVVAIMDYGAFVRITEGITGLIHISDISWTERVTNLRDHLTEGQRVRCVVLGVDKERQRLSLGLKQLTPDPWEDAKANYPEGSRIKGKVRSVTEKGILVEIEEDVMGFVEPKDLSWDKRAPKPQKLYKRDDEITAVVIGYDDNKRRLRLGVKQLNEHPFDQYARTHPEGSIVRGRVTSLTNYGAFISLAPGVEGLLHISQIDLKRVDDPKSVLQVGQLVDVKIKELDFENKKISLSRREFLLEQERREVEQYLKDKTPGGIKLGEILKNIKISPPSS